MIFRYSNHFLPVKMDGTIIFGSVDVNEVLWGQILQHAVFKDLDYREKYHVFVRPLTTNRK